ncbi:MAG: metallophosphoesterase [Lachnospiraceae bacterium]|nr:metallophosphoesterase [Lachnospiraceae bacterium]
MKIIGMIILLIGCFILWQHFELKKFRITSYEYQTDKITQSVNFAVVADLHAHVYGRDNDILIQKIKEQKPDIILVPGDMIVSRYPETYETAYQTFEKLTEIAPVYFSNGNHESRVSKVPVMQTEAFLEYENRVRKLGVHILNNASEEVILYGGKFCISGLEIPLECYGKGSYEPLPEHFIRDVLGDAKQDSVQILMAHNPMFAKEYAEWGADVSVCGHTHGGLVRIPGIGSVISPQFELFPKYDAGEFNFGDRKVYVSKGLGTHTFHIRVFDRAEVLMIRINKM